MTNVVELKSKSGTKFECEMIDSEVVQIFTLLDDKDFFELINNGKEEMEGFISSMHETAGWCIGVKCLESKSVCIWCDRRGNKIAHKTVDDALAVLVAHGYGCPMVYNSPINTDNAKYFQ